MARFCCAAPALDASPDEDPVTRVYWTAAAMASMHFRCVAAKPSRHSNRNVHATELWLMFLKGLHGSEWPADPIGTKLY